MPHATPSRGDTILFAVSAKRQLSWSSFTSVLDNVFVPDARLGSDVVQVRARVADLGDWLAHWDVVPDGRSAMICVAPPTLALLPWPGLPVAVLCGSRSPETVEELGAVCRRHKAILRATPQAHLHKYAPTRIDITANSVETIRVVAAALNVPIQSEPAAWRLVAASASIAEYLSSLQWSAGPELNWNRLDFDSETLRLGPARVSTGRAGLRLSAYEHPDHWAREDRLWRGEEFAIVDRRWGRFAVLADQAITVCRYDAVEGLFKVPRQVPLPKLMARSLGLCSGRAPVVVQADGVWYVSYAGVPASIAGAIARKLEPSCGPGASSTEDGIA